MPRVAEQHRTYAAHLDNLKIALFPEEAADWTIYPLPFTTNGFLSQVNDSDIQCNTAGHMKVTSKFWNAERFHTPS